MLAMDIVENMSSSTTSPAEPNPAGADQTLRTEHDIRLPTELWLDVLLRVPADTIQAIALTCRPLRWIAQPFLFKAFIVRPRVTSSTGFLVDKIRAGAFEFNSWIMALNLPHISASIEELRIIPERPTLTNADSQTPLQGNQVIEEMIDCIFNILPRLTNLKRLVCHSITFSPRRLAALQHLSLLNHLELHSCCVASTSIPDLSLMQLESLTVDAPFTSLDDHASVPLLSAVLGSKYMKRIFVGPGNDIIDALAQHPIKFDLLSALDIPVSCVTSPDFISVLDRFSHLREFSLRLVSGNYTVPSLNFTLPPDVLPKLESFRGPHAYVSVFTKNRPVVKIEITSSCQPANLSETLSALETDKIHSLKFKVHHLDGGLLRTVHESFPSLRHLAISCLGVDIHDLSYALNTARIHKKLSTIQLTVQMGLPRLTASWRNLSAKMFIHRLLETYPILQCAKLMYQPQLFVAWQRPLTCASVNEAVESADLWIEKQDEESEKPSVVETLKVKA